MIYNTRNRSNNATESQKKKTCSCFNAHFKSSQSKIAGLIKMTLKSLAMLKCEIITNIHAVQ